MRIKYSGLFFLVIVICFLIIFPFEIANGFDGKREGVFIGLGIEPGVAMLPWIDADDGNFYYSVVPSFNVPNFRLGYGLSEQFTIFLTHRASLNGGYFYSSYYEDFETTDLYLDGTSGIGFDYFPSQLQSFLITGCLGFATTVGPYLDDVEDILIGLGFSGGLGYEFSRYLAINFMLDYRRFPATYDTIHTITLSLAFNFTLY